MLEEQIKEYCTGCGLCKSVHEVELVANSKGFWQPSSLREEDRELCEKVCMSSGVFWKEVAETNVWGKNIEMPYYAFAKDESIRYKASSGGILSACAIYLLEKGIVDGIIHTGVSNESQIKTMTMCSLSKEEIIQHCGSRYAISSPLISIDEYIATGKKYAYIGKPCDVMVLRNLANIDKRVNESFPYMFSFLCAGMPSEDAGRMLLKRLNTTEEDCEMLTYRGEGWPGYTCAVDKTGRSTRITYEESWGKILGRDVAKCCRFCLDGIGEAADIACGDGWYSRNGKPDFSEHSGRNVVFLRTEKGKKLLDAMNAEGVIEKEGCSNIYDELIVIQNYQYVRRTTMFAKILALRVMWKLVPNYPIKMIRKLGQGIPLTNKIRVFMGICARVVKHKI